MTGTLSSISYFANAAIMKTGIMNASPGNDSDVAEPFDYNFKIKTLTGEVVDFNQFKGKVVFINLWATWCGPCRVEMPSIQELYNGLDKDKIQFVMLSLDRNEDLPKIIKYVDKNSFTFPVYQPKGYLPELFQVPSIPTTFIIDKNGNVVSKKVGTTNFNTTKFKKYLEGLAK
jgi:thiol-disulfide isomerase/thioredoxin